MTTTSLVLSICASALTIYSILITTKNKKEIQSIKAEINSTNQIKTGKNDGIISTGPNSKNKINRK